MDDTGADAFSATVSPNSYHGIQGSLTTTTSPICPLVFTPKPQSFSTSGTYTARTIATVSGDWSYETHVALLGVTGGNGTTSAANLTYTRTAGGNGKAIVPGSVTADITFNGNSPELAQLLFQVSGPVIPTQVVVVPISTTPPADCAANVTPETTVTLGGFSQNLITHVWSQTVRVQNTSASAIAGPVDLALDNLSPNATLTGSAGTTSCAAPTGSPFVSLGSGLAPGQTAAVTLSFTNSQTGQSITYTPRILAGANEQ